MAMRSRSSSRAPRPSTSSLTFGGGARGVLFLHGRLNFYDVQGVRSRFNSGAPSCIVAYGEHAYTVLQNAVMRDELRGKLLLLGAA